MVALEAMKVLESDPSCLGLMKCDTRKRHFGSIGKVTDRSRNVTVRSKEIQIDDMTMICLLIAYITRINNLATSQLSITAYNMDGEFV